MKHKKLITIIVLTVAIVGLGAGTVFLNNPSKTASVYKVPELGIEFTVDKDLMDLQHSKDEGGEGKMGVDFSTDSLAAQGGATCKAGATQSVTPFPLGQVVKADERPEKVAEERQNNPEEALGVYVAAVGDEYLYYQAPPDEPCSTAPAAASLQKSQTAALQTALKTARPIE